MTMNPWILLLIVAVAAVVVDSRKTDAPWARSFRFYLWFGLVVVLIRVIFRIIFGAPLGPDDPVLIPLPGIPLPEIARGIDLFGPLTLGSFLMGLYDGMRLATVIICVGAANSLANPRQLLASVPPALYEVGTSIVVALSVFPQLADSVRRVHRARQLRGDPGKGTRALRRTVIPVLEDALERSLTLAASMDSRGYGRSGGASARERWWTGSLMIFALIALGVGAFGYLDSTAPAIMSWPMLLIGLLVAGLALRSAGRRVQRTRYRPIKWRSGELAAVVSGVVVAAGLKLASLREPDLLLPDWNTWPLLSPLVLLVLAVGLVPAVLTPPPVRYMEVDA